MALKDDILQQMGLTEDKLTRAESDVLYSWLDDLKKNTMTLDKVKDYVRAMRDAIEESLVVEPEFTYIFIFKVPNRKQILLKARLRNCMMIESFLAGPEKAKRMIEMQIATLTKKK